MRNYLKRLGMALIGKWPSGQVNEFDRLKIKTWLHADHFHCKDCNNQMTFLTRLSWDFSDGYVGIRALGICQDCRLLIVESEHGRIKYEKIKL